MTAPMIKVLQKLLTLNLNQLLGDHHMVVLPLDLLLPIHTHPLHQLVKSFIPYYQPTYEGPQFLVVSHEFAVQIV